MSEIEKLRALLADAHHALRTNDDEAASEIASRIDDALTKPVAPAPLSHPTSCSIYDAAGRCTCGFDPQQAAPERTPLAELVEGCAECARWEEYDEHFQREVNDVVQRERDEARAHLAAVEKLLPREAYISDKTLAENLAGWIAALRRDAKERSEFAAAETAHANRWAERAHAAEKRCKEVGDEAALAQHERDEAQAEAAAWRKATGRDDPEALDSYLGRAGIDAHLNVLIDLMKKAEADRDEARAEIADAIEAARVRGAKVLGDGNQPKSLLEVVSGIMHDLLSAEAGRRDAKEVYDRLKTERDEARSEVERLRSSWKWDAIKAYKRGAEAMREAAARAASVSARYWSPHYVADDIRALPVPEDKP